MIDPQPPERVRQEIPNGGRPSIHSEKTAIGTAECTKLHGQEHSVAPAFYGTADEHLVMPHAVEVARIEQRYTPLDRFVNGCNALVFIGAAVKVGHAHAPETERKNLGTMIPEPSRLQRTHFNVSRNRPSYRGDVAASRHYYRRATLELNR